MYKQMASTVLLWCASATALAEHGFEPAVAIAPDTVGAQAVAVGDVTGDGRDDVLVLANGASFYRNRVTLYAQAAGGFAPPVAIDYHPEPDSGEAGGTGLALADLDADGDLEILVSYGTYPTAALAVLRNDGDSFTTGTAVTLDPLLRMKFTDVDGDGHLDVVGDEVFGSIAVLHGDGGGGLGDATWLPYRSIFSSSFQLADMDGDGRQDLAYRAWDAIVVHRNEGTGFAAEPSVLLRTEYYNRLAIADVTGDGRMDLALTTGSWPTRPALVYPQGSDGRFRRKLPLGGWQGISSLHAADLNRDGRQDLLMLSQTTDYALITRLARSDGFAAPVLHQVGNVVQFVLGDVNDDGTTDAVLLGSYGDVSFMAGRSTPTDAMDLAVFLGLNSVAAVVRTENRGTVATAAYELTLVLDPRHGSVGAGTVPAGCIAFNGSGGSLAATCQMPALAPGAYHERLFPFDIAATAPRNLLLGTARVNYDWPELRQDNNVAIKRIQVVPSPP